MLLYHVLLFVVLFLSLLFFETIIGINNNDDSDHFVDNQHQHYYLPSTLLLSGENLNLKKEYENFRWRLMMMKQTRDRNMLRLDNFYKISNKTNRPNIGDNIVDDDDDDKLFRTYNYTTGIQFEEEFDCDLNLLSDCESSLLRKIEIIEGRYVVFTMDRLEEDEVSSQIDVLQICQSMDKEFSCLINYANKCQEKMTWSTFSILKYIITQNNETIVSCKQKQIDWLGPQSLHNSKVFTENEWIDQNGISHTINSNTKGPCISTNLIHSCWQTNIGNNIEFGHFEIENVEQCESVYQFERCLKKHIYEDDSKCSLDEKEATIQILLGTIKWNTGVQQKLSSSSKICNDLKHYHRKQNIIGMQENFFKDFWDRSRRFAYDLRVNFGKSLDPYCNWVVKKADKPCERRFDKRLRKLWSIEDIDGVQLDQQLESDTICCAINEFKQCVSIYVLIRCGKDSFRFFNNHTKIAELDQCTHQSPELCLLRLKG